MDVDTILLECDERMDKTIDYLQRELRGVRTGRATTALVEYVKVDYYGSPTDLRELGAVSVPEPTQLMVKPFDPGAKQAIIKAIESAGLGLNPQAEGNAIRIIVPTPSVERRKQLITQVKKLAEESKVAIRNERRDANKHIDQLATDRKDPLPEDVASKAKEEIDAMTKRHTERIDEISSRKVKEIEEI
ncbi:MAG TPA: ribosome recycling factor [Phycisphaerales bacterium]|nr:ribosome recycling factor [Phycisphaerales bacterium]HMP37125.1 ribosome recycling factor [Phycisphaerales bacterium]